MRILMTRLNPSHHRFSIFRVDGSTDSALLETRSMLVHDLVHYAVEMEVPFREGFYGLLAKGKRLAELNDKTLPWPTGSEIAAAEALVGPLQSMLKGEFDPAVARAQFEMLSANPPTVELLARIGARFRSVHGKYASTRFGDTLELEWTEQQAVPRPRKR